MIILTYDIHWHYQVAMKMSQNQMCFDHNIDLFSCQYTIII